MSTDSILLLMNSNILYTVKYGDKTKTLTLVKGHNSTFDGKSHLQALKILKSQHMNSVTAKER